MGLSYVDIFYSHRPDPETPLEETVAALTTAVSSGKALYVGLSNYNPEQTRQAVRLLRAAGTPCLIHQVRYSMLQRTPEAGLLSTLAEEGVGAIAFSPLAQGLLSDRYAAGLPEDSRAAGPSRFLNPADLDESRQGKVRDLRAVAAARQQTLAQMALAWLLRDARITSVLIGASKVEQLRENVEAAARLSFEEAELQQIEAILTA